MVFFTGSPVSFAMATTMGSMIAIALTGEANVENTTLISIAANSTRRFPFAPAPSFVTTNCFKSSKKVV